MIRFIRSYLSFLRLRRVPIAWEPPDPGARAWILADVDRRTSVAFAEVHYRGQSLVLLENLWVSWIDPSRWTVISLDQAGSVLWEWDFRRWPPCWQLPDATTAR